DSRAGRLGRNGDLSAEERCARVQRACRVRNEDEIDDGKTKGDGERGASG
ncbi:hypothetical protein CALVIDRAFT_534805, partial [Calocera viscosa TUFC12733]